MLLTAMSNSRRCSRNCSSVGSLDDCVLGAGCSIMRTAPHTRRQDCPEFGHDFPTLAFSTLSCLCGPHVRAVKSGYVAQYDVNNGLPPGNAARVSYFLPPF